MAFHMDTALFDATTDWEHADYKLSQNGLKSAKVIPAMLEAGTEYVLYGTAATGDTVLTLATFATDPDPNLENGFYNVPLGDNTYTIRKDEPFLFSVMVNSSGSIEVYFDLKEGGGALLYTTIGNLSESVVKTPGTENITHFFSIMDEGDGESNTITSGIIDKGLTMPPKHMDSDNGFSFYFVHDAIKSPYIKFVYQE